MTAGDHIWYAGYGSNLDVVRFGTYLQGGRAPGTRRDNPGARDTSAPLEEPVARRGGLDHTCAVYR